MRLLRDLLVASLILPATAAAQVVPIGPFVGAMSEDFEAQPYAFDVPCVPGGVLGGAATICAPAGKGVNVIGGSVFPGCSIAANGARMCLLGSAVAGTGVDITFATPPGRFGGLFMVNHDGPAGVKVTFFAGAATVLGPVAVPLPTNCAWHWLGWDLRRSGVDRIHLESNHASTGYLGLDDLQLDACLTTFGVGCPGTGGVVPALDAPACVKAGGVATISITRGLPGGTAVLVLGLAPASLPMGFGCTLYAAPLLPVSQTIPLGATGAADLHAQIPASSAGATVTLQVFVLDPGGPGDYANSNGLELRL